MDDNKTSQTDPQRSAEEINYDPVVQQLPQEQVAQSPQEDIGVPQKKPMSRGLVKFLRFLVIAGGLFAVIVIGLGVSFSACFTIKGPPPPECGPVSFVSLILLPAGSLFFLIPLARKIK